MLRARWSLPPSCVAIGLGRSAAATIAAVMSHQRQSVAFWGGLGTLPAKGLSWSKSGCLRLNTAYQLRLLVPERQGGRGHAAADHARQAELDVAGGGGRDAAERERSLADLPPKTDVALVAGSFALEFFDLGQRFLAQPRGVDGFGRLDHLIEHRDHRLLLML